MIKGAGVRHFDDQIYFIEYSSDKNSAYNNTDESTPKTRQKLLILFDDMIPDMISNKKIYPTVTKIWGRKLNNSVVFCSQSYFAVPKDYTLHTFSLWTLQTNKIFSKFLLIIDLILTSKILGSSAENELQHLIHFC